MPLADAPASVVREFALRVLCMSSYDLYREHPGVIKRVYRAWTSRQELVSVCGSEFAVAAIFEQFQKLLLRGAAEVPLSEDDPPSEECTLSGLQVISGYTCYLLGMQKGKFWERLTIAGAAVMVGTRIVGCGIHLPDLSLPAVAPAWRPTANTTYHLTTVGFSIGAVFITYYNCEQLQGIPSRVSALFEGASARRRRR